MSTTTKPKRQEWPLRHLDVGQLAILQVPASGLYKPIMRYAHNYGSRMSKKFKCKLSACVNTGAKVVLVERIA